VTGAGDSVRIRLDNTFGTAPLVLGKAAIALRVRGPAVAAGLVKPLTFGGKEQVTIAPGSTAVSDPAALRVEAQQDVAVSLFVSGADVQPSQHNNAQVTSYLTADGAGDQTASQDGKPFTGKTTSMLWLKAIDVRAGARAGTIVAFGDSITDGTCSTLDAHDRWEDVLAERMALAGNAAHAVINEGIGGNTVAAGANYNPPLNSPAGVDRLDRDVLSHAGVTHVVLFLGTNDIRRGASAEQVIAGIKDIAARVKQKGIKMIGLGRRQDQGQEQRQRMDPQASRLRRGARLRPSGGRPQRCGRHQHRLRLQRRHSPVALRLFPHGQVDRPRLVRQVARALYSPWMPAALMMGPHFS